jgi:thioredoxin 2
MSDSKHVVCPHCDATTVVPPGDLFNQPACDKCKLALFTAHPVELNEQNFMQHISNNDIPVLVDFWEPGCPPCNMMAPAYEKAAQRLEPELRVAKLNIEEAPQLAVQYKILHIPTLVLFRDGVEISRKLGAMDAALIEAWIKSKS